MAEIIAILTPLVGNDVAAAIATGLTGLAEVSIDTIVAFLVDAGIGAAAAEAVAPFLLPILFVI